MSRPDQFISREIDQIGSYFAQLDSDLYRIDNINQPLVDVISSSNPNLPKNYQGYLGMPIATVHQGTWLQLKEAALDITPENPSKRIVIGYPVPDQNESVYIGFSLTAKYNSDLSKIAGYIVQGQDITEKTVRECHDFLIMRETMNRAIHDGLTGLYNHRFFMEKLDESSKRRDRIALGFFDLDRFKVINDTRGHKYGDQYLIDTANFLLAQFRAEDTLARYGGDEFAAILAGDQLNPQVLRDKIKKIEQNLCSENINRTKLGLIPLRMSFDFVMAEIDKTDPSRWDMKQALVNVDHAMYNNKRRNKSRK